MKKVSHHWGINEAMEHSKWLLMEKLDVRDFNSNIIWLPEKKKFYHKKKHMTANRLSIYICYCTNNSNNRAEMCNCCSC